jgi:cyclophilin family peptidyl-prolyl cis-trans isomerase
MSITKKYFALFIAIGLNFSTPAADAHPEVRVKTNLGEFELQLHEDRVPKTVENFLTYVREGFYKDTLFHRLVPGLLLQAGYYSSNWDAKHTRAPIPNEASKAGSNRKWTVAMGHGADAHSATSEFFINLNDNTDFDFQSGGDGAYYCAFGEITKGFDIVTKMLEAGIISGGDFIGDQPVRNIIIQDITILKDN